MESYEALPGTAVRVREGGTRRTEFAGMWGAIERSFGSPKYPALDVRLENGRRELFWFYQLDSAEEKLVVPPLPQRLRGINGRSNPVGGSLGGVLAEGEEDTRG